MFTPLKPFHVVGGTSMAVKPQDRDAIPSLKKLGYDEFELLHKQNCRYFAARGPDDHSIKLKVHARSETETDRYSIGIAYQLFGVVDEFVLWIKGKRSLFMIPSRELEAIWKRTSETPSNSNQWQFNLWYNGEIENPRCSLAKYKRGFA
jgi:hypothetical protein